MQETERQAMDRYFQSLPVWIQESIKQSGVQWSTQDELRQLADNLRRQ